MVQEKREERKRRDAGEPHDMGMEQGGVAIVAEAIGARQQGWKPPMPDAPEVAALR